MKLGLYISVPFCRTKCSFCNFASGVASPKVFENYVAHVERDIRDSESLARELGAELPHEVDSVYLGGGTPSVLAPVQLEQLFAAVCGTFDVVSNPEITVECAPGTLSDPVVEALCRCGVNRVSLGVQSFNDREAHSVGRLHTREIALADIARLRSAGISEISLDLIAGLPYQTAESWRDTLQQTIATAVPHVSVYMLEVDEDSRLGRELIAGGTRYHAHHVPDDEVTADLYEEACTTLDAAGVRQYEISNFAREGHASRHNLKYWTRQPYLGFGVDAHSMLELNPATPHEAIRFATPDELEPFLAKPLAAHALHSRTTVDKQAALEEAWFLGLRLNEGVDLESLRHSYGAIAVEGYRKEIARLMESALLEQSGSRLRLTARGRLLSNIVFAEFLREPEPKR